MLKIGAKPKGVTSLGSSALRAMRRKVNKHQHPSRRKPSHTSSVDPSMAPRPSPTVSSALEQLQKPPVLKLLTIAETLSPRDLPQSAKKRNSALSDDSEQNGDTHPAALEADLTHYKVTDLILDVVRMLITFMIGTLHQVAI